MVALRAPGNVTGAGMRAAQAVTSRGQKRKSHIGQADGPPKRVSQMALKAPATHRLDSTDRVKSFHVNW